jgi:hypothetical protein
MIDVARTPVICWRRPLWYRMHSCVVAGRLGSMAARRKEQPPELLRLHAQVDRWLRGPTTKVNPFRHCSGLPVPEPSNLSTFWVAAWPVGKRRGSTAEASFGRGTREANSFSLPGVSRRDHARIAHHRRLRIGWLPRSGRSRAGVDRVSHDASTLLYSQKRSEGWRCRSRASPPWDRVRHLTVDGATWLAG